MRDRFAARFGAAGDVYVVRAPGRINLIGEHVDYHGLPVLPMAIQWDVRVAFRRRQDRMVRMAGAGPFTERTFAIAPAIEPYPLGDWGNYAKASASALAAVYGDLRGYDALVEGTIPPAAGLSSSSALVIATALTLLHANAAQFDPATLAQQMAVGERYVGTQGGGMDQTVSLCAQGGAALRIDFSPFGYRPVPIPADWAFVVAHSLVVAEKSDAAREHYNAAGQRARSAMARAATGEPEYRHVVTEAARVDQAETALRSGELLRFGELMNASHASLRDDLQVSCPALDELAVACVAAGAAGARLTGAGFGGCVVALCRDAEAAKVMRLLEETFYATRPQRIQFERYLFRAVASQGAGMVEDL